MRKRILRIIFLVSVVVGLTLVWAELFARYLRPASTVEYEVASDIGHVLAPNQTARLVGQDYDVRVTTNGEGFHDVEHQVSKPDGVYRIIVLGDSFIEALQVPVEEGFTQQLQQALQNWHETKDIEVINLGISGNGPGQYYRVLEARGLRYEPDLVLMAVLPDNDFRDSHRSLSGAVTKPFYSIRPDGNLQYIPPRVSGLGVSIKPWLRRSALLRLIRERVATMPVEKWLARFGLLAPASGVKPDASIPTMPLDWHVYVVDAPEPWADAYRVTLRMIEESKTLAEQSGAQFLVMLIGSTATVENRWQEALTGVRGAEAFTWDVARPYREIKRLGKQTGFAVVSLVEAFRRDFQVTHISRSWPHDGHWNSGGHRVAAETVSTYLKEHRNTYGMKQAP